MQLVLKPPLGFGLLLFTTLLIAAHAYWPGLWGFFIFDDFPNLEGLEAITKNPTLLQFLQYIGDGTSGRLGRPISLATFAMQYHHWPQNPAAFKYLNLMIHLLNGVLLFWLTFKLFTLAKLNEYRVLIIATIAMLIWLCHPMQTSTVLYVVQRMAQLSTLFALATLITYIYGRHFTLNGSTVKGYAVMSMALAIGVPLAMLSKENGILIPLLILVVEATLLHHITKPRQWHIWSGIFLWLPIVLLIGYFVFFTNIFTSGYDKRSFTLFERILTETRILSEYLFKFLLPSPSRFGMFFDDFSLSTSLISPWTTLPSVVLMVSLIFISIVLRKRFPVVAFALLWFFSGHLLESTIIPLELYFEHRNYLPMIGLSVGVAFYSTKLIDVFKQRNKKTLVAILGIILLGIIVLMTRHESALWGQPLTQAKIWADENPSSKRAQDWYASVLISQQRYDEAREKYEQIAALDPLDGAPFIMLTELSCYDATNIPPDLSATLTRLRHGKKYYHASVNTISTILALKESHKCDGVETKHLIAMIEAMLKNNAYKTSRVSLYVLLGRAHQILGQKQLALNAYTRCYNLSPKMEMLLIMISLATETGQLELARKYIKLAENDTRLSLIQKTVYSNRLSGLNNAVTLLEKIDAKSPIN